MATRMRTGGSSESVKSVIASLVLTIQGLNLPSPTAEDFRRAKFNQTTNADVFWKLLHALLSRLRSPLIPPDVSCPVDTTKTMVTAALRAIGYKLPPQDGSGRQLLLAFAWLQASFNPILRLAVEMEPWMTDISQMKRTNIEFRIEGGKKKISDDLICPDRLAWEQGRVRFALKRMASHLADVRCALETLAKSTCPHLPIGVVALIREGENLTELTSKLEKRCLMLEHCHHFLTHQSLFWSWMNSVVELERVDRGVSSDVCPSSTHVAPGDDDSRGDGARCNDPPCVPGNIGSSIKALLRKSTALEVLLSQSLMSITKENKLSPEFRTAVSQLLESDRDKFLHYPGCLDTILSPASGVCFQRSTSTDSASHVATESKRIRWKAKHTEAIAERLRLLNEKHMEDLFASCSDSVLCITPKVPSDR